MDFKNLGHRRIVQKFLLKNGQELEFNPVMKVEAEQIATVVINSNTRQKVDGVTTISPNVIRTIKGAQPGVENILKTLPGVNISNELSTQYSV
ncbi:MAG: TonB-dependent receptor, partial [Winogradskyella sp.]|nr:TonB-dependent receptor [Winogradskyella sp.]